MSNIIGTIPITLSNGSLADATQVMSNFNYIITQINANAAQLAGGNAFTGTQTVGGDTIATLLAAQTMTNKTLTSVVNLGINTASPISTGGYGQATLDGVTGSAINLEMGAANTMQLLVQAGLARLIAIGAGTTMRLETNAGTSLSATPDGNLTVANSLGIGAAPGVALDVKGSGSNARVRVTSTDGGGVSATFLANDSTQAQLGTSTNHQLVFQTNAVAQLVLTNDGRLYGLSLHNNGGSVSGTTNQYLASGTYTPTMTNVTNIASGTAFQSQWIRIGNVVTVSGGTTITTTAGGGTPTEFGLSFPIASTISGAVNCGGSAISDPAGGNIVQIRGDTVNNRAQCRFNSNSVAANGYYFTFTYLLQ